MRVILKTDVKKVGKRGEIVTVADGYARNYLIARDLAVPETKKNLEVLKEMKAEEAAEEAKRVEEAKKTAAEMEKMILNFTVKSGEGGRVFGSVSTKQIVEALSRQGVHVDKRKILDSNPIQTLGVTNVRIELHKDVIGTIRVRLFGSEK